MNTLLVPFYDDDAAQSALESSFVIAERFAGHVEGLFVMRPPQIIDGEGIVLADSYLTQLKEEGRRLGDRAKQRFESSVADRGVAMHAVDGAEPGTSAAWTEMEGLEGQVIGEHGRLFDLIVIGREFGHPWIDWHVMCEAALFESGRPVLVCGAKVPESIGSNVVIAWNGSPETARTLALGAPLVTGADSVLVLSVEGWGVPGPSGEELAAHLRRKGLTATARTENRAGRAPGEVVLDICASVGADLLIKGAYTQSRLRQLVFGGATRQILMQGELPVLFAH